jgi:hypothetical protein
MEVEKRDQSVLRVCRCLEDYVHKIGKIWKLRRGIVCTERMQAKRLRTYNRQKMEVEKRDQLVVVHTYIRYHRRKMEVEKWDQSERWK